MNDDYKLEMEREIFRRTPEGRSLNKIRNNWPFPEPLKNRLDQGGAIEDYMDENLKREIAKDKNDIP